MGMALTSFGLFAVSTTVQVSGTTHNWAPSGLSGSIVIYVSTSNFSDATITGLTGGEDGRVIFVVNISPVNIVTLSHNAGGSSAANRFQLSGLLGDNTDVTLFPFDSLALLYDTSVNFWKQAMDIV